MKLYFLAVEIYFLALEFFFVAQEKPDLLRRKTGICCAGKPGFIAQDYSIFKNRIRLKAFNDKNINNLIRY